MYQDYKDLLSAFHAHGVKYLIVGGYAVIFHAQFCRRNLKPVPLLFLVLFPMLGAWNCLPMTSLRA